LPHWKEELLKACLKAYYKGGEVKIVFIKRQNKVRPVIQQFIDNQVLCDEETLLTDED
jgi:hypothetical protein